MLIPRAVTAPYSAPIKCRTKNATKFEQLGKKLQLSNSENNIKDPAPVVQRVDNAIRWINFNPADNAIVFPNTYPLDGDLSGR